MRSFTFAKLADRFLKYPLRPGWAYLLIIGPGSTVPVHTSGNFHPMAYRYFRGEFRADEEGCNFLVGVMKESIMSELERVRKLAEELDSEGGAKANNVPQLLSSLGPSCDQVG